MKGVPCILKGLLYSKLCDTRVPCHTILTHRAEIPLIGVQTNRWSQKARPHPVMYEGLAWAIEGALDRQILHHSGHMPQDSSTCAHHVSSRDSAAKSAARSITLATWAWGPRSAAEGPCSSSQGQTMIASLRNWRSLTDSMLIR